MIRLFQNPLFAGLILLILSATPALAIDNNTGISDDLIANLITGSDDQAVSAVAQLAVCEYTTLVQALQDFRDYPQSKQLGGFVHYLYSANDSAEAPWFVFVPEGYNPTTPTPMVIWLHGGVGRREFITQDTAYASTADDFLDLDAITMCRENNWLCVVPMARFDCLWWNNTGMNYLTDIIRQIKRGYNIDDSRVILSGFSDGGSGSYHFAFLAPTDFSLIFPYSGHIGVGSRIGGMQVYPHNLAVRPIYAVNGGADGLYPAAAFVDPLRQIILATDARLSYTVYDTAHHDHGYLRLEMPKMADRIRKYARDPFASKLYWECNDLSYGRADWIEITGIDTTLERAEWQTEVNYQLEDSRITVGFMANREFADTKVLVESLSDDEDAPARTAGLLAGDHILEFDGIPLASLADLGRAKDTKQRGDSFTMKVSRDGKEIMLSGKFPPIGHYDQFVYEKPSAAVRAVNSGNSFFVETSRVASLSIYIHPRMVQLDQPVKIIVNGKELFNGILQPDAEFMLDEFRHDHDRQLLWAGKIDVTL